MGLIKNINGMIEIGLSSRNIKYYENLGYKIPRYKDRNGVMRTPCGTNILVKYESLPYNSNVKIQYKCDNCGEISNFVSWYSYKKHLKLNNKIFCKKCSMKLFGVEKQLRTKLINSESFYHWILSKYGEKISNLFHSNKNTINLNDISYSSNQKIWLKCPYCGTEKFISPNRFIKDGLGCLRCSDGVSFPNKIAFNFLIQSNINFISEYSPNWIKPKRYDFYFKVKNSQYILEMDGQLHTVYNNRSKQTAKESKEIDDYKDKIANEHGIEVIRIDCQKSELDYIKNNIVNSKLSELFDLTNIDWNECEKYAYKSLVKTVCDMWTNKRRNSQFISNELQLNKKTVIKYLKQGAKLNWCDYSTKEVSEQNNIDNGQRCIERCSQKVYCVELNQIFNSMHDAQKLLKINNENISACCNGKRKSAGKHPVTGEKLHWRFVDKN